MLMESKNSKTSIILNLQLLHGSFQLVSHPDASWTSSLKNTSCSCKAFLTVLHFSTIAGWVFV